MVKIKKRRPKGLKAGDFVRVKNVSGIFRVNSTYYTPYLHESAARLSNTNRKGSVLETVELIYNLKKVVPTKKLKEWWR